jgi:hypothetical protein
MRRRDTILIVIGAILIAVLAWAFLARDESSAPESEPGGARPAVVRTYEAGA